MTNPDLLAVNLSGGGFGTKDWNGDVVLPDGSYGHLLLVFTAPTADKDGALLVGIETVAPGARSPVGYHHGVKSTEVTANPESVLHGHKQDKIGATRVELGNMDEEETRVELGNMGEGDWHSFLDTIKQDWEGKLEAAKDSARSGAVRGTGRPASVERDATHPSGAGGLRRYGDRTPTRDTGVPGVRYPVWTCACDDPAAHSRRGGGTRTWASLNKFSWSCASRTLSNDNWAPAPGPLCIWQRNGPLSCSEGTAATRTAPSCSGGLRQIRPELALQHQPSQLAVLLRDRRHQMRAW